MILTQKLVSYNIPSSCLKIKYKRDDSSSNQFFSLYFALRSLTIVDIVPSVCPTEVFFIGYSLSSSLPGGFRGKISKCFMLIVHFSSVTEPFLLQGHEGPLIALEVRSLHKWKAFHWQSLIVLLWSLVSLLKNTGEANLRVLLSFCCHRVSSCCRL